MTKLRYTALMGNKVDLAHIRAVKVEKHAQARCWADMVGVFAWVVYAAVCMNSTNLVAHMLVIPKRVYHDFWMIL